MVEPAGLGWGIAGAYLVAALLAGGAGRQAGSRPEQLVWALLTAALLALAINKQLDLQTDLTRAVRRLALMQGWYGERRLVQMLFLAGLAVAATVAGAWVLKLARASRPAVRVAVLGGAVLVAFVLMRAASFHHVDQALLGQVAGWRLAVVLELAGIAVVALAAAVALSGQAVSDGAQ